MAYIGGAGLGVGTIGLSVTALKADNIGLAVVIFIVGFGLWYLWLARGVGLVTRRLEKW